MNFESLEIQKQIMPTDNSQRRSEKNEVICIVLMLIMLQGYGL